jgi:SAM-dependent methyltransferase
MNRSLRKKLARAIIIDRATWGDKSAIGRIARERTEENYRFASRFVRGMRVLDVGGGAGIGQDLLLASGAVSIVSLDRQQAIARPDRDARIETIEGDFLTYPLPDAQFDVVICLGTLFYLSDVDAALAKMNRVLAASGTLIVNCINQRLVRRYFGMRLDEIDTKFSTAFEEAGFRTCLKGHFGTEPELFVQQPVRHSGSLLDGILVWLTPFTWPLRRHPVVPRKAGEEGMYLYGVVHKAA